VAKGTGVRIDASIEKPTDSRGHVHEQFVRLRETGDPLIRHDLLRRFLPLARKLAARYVSPHEPLDDLLQVAGLGHIGAVDRYDPTREAGFAAFAIPTILGELKRHLRSTGWSIHVPRGAQKLAIRVRLGSREIAEPMGCSQMEVSRLLRRAASRVRELTDAPVDGASPGNVGVGRALNLRTEPSCPI